ncbi:MerR family DNA-binding protein [Aestuariirhabdus sp. Z084]|uniref:MerR family transcriptional regulator n=1 Tax=Aestuariirhabdus haliotis TaxID=2918751 RepID=UPI00201B42EB|nr:MerR family transcriptional regulator [Aestuariirhabdus haliotis]MCL6415991.1 MerR family DNA-binding protein [Aestuariirhabdus haliotis]MCL6419976.1 MerR family DNA-binding protein [Aestuariirhabdus haliotis]
MRVKQLAEAAHVTTDTVRFYARKGLLMSTRDPDNGYQHFNQEALRQLRFIQQARTLGFSLQEIEQILHHQHSASSPCPMVRDLLSQRVPKVRQQIEELQTLLHRMENALDRWQEMPDGLPDGHTICRLIEHWDSDQQETSNE